MKHLCENAKLYLEQYFDAIDGTTKTFAEKALRLLNASK